uniref:Uncharacterized protein n=1 Tax=Helianthus annuus TaxID=4232 RepID=A0A251S9B6_HELAN
MSALRNLMSHVQGLVLIRLLPLSFLLSNQNTQTSSPLTHPPLLLPLIHLLHSSLYSHSPEQSRSRQPVAATPSPLSSHHYKLMAGDVDRNKMKD